MGDITYSITLDGRPDMATDLGGREQVVTRVLWTLTGETADGVTASTSGSTDLPAPIEGQLFTAFADVTEEAMISWIWAHTSASRGEGYMAERKAIVAEAIEHQRTVGRPSESADVQ